MTTRRSAWMAVALLALLVTGSLAWQHRAARALAYEVGNLRALAQEHARLEGENIRLRMNGASEEKLAALRDDREALSRLRGEIETLKAIKKRASAVAPPASAKTEGGRSAPHPASAWTHAGRVTPGAALETTLWAGAGRHVDLIASALAFETEGARALAESMLASLPEEQRAYHGTPERLLARLTAEAMDYDAFRIVEEIGLGDEIMQSVRAQLPEVTDMVVLRAELIRGEEPRQKFLHLRRYPDGWRLMVPEIAVETYASRLPAAARF